MNLGQIRSRFRRDADDTLEPYLFATADLDDLINEAVHEAVLRARLLHESANASVCNVDITAGTAVYALHAALYEITHISFQADGSSRRVALSLVSTERMDKLDSDWRTREGEPECAIQDDTTIRIVPKPESDGTLYLEGFRFPLTDLSATGDAPEIHLAHHRYLHYWPLYRFFSIPDKETFDPTRAARAEAEFSNYFGLRPDADLRRITREDTVHRVEPVWP